MPLTLSINITGFNLEVTDIVWLNNNDTVVSQTSDIYTISGKVMANNNNNNIVILIAIVERRYREISRVHCRVLLRV